MERWFYKAGLRLRSLFQSSSVDAELDEEIRIHFDQLVNEQVGRGLSAADARRAARMAIGGFDQQKEACRDTRRVAWIDETARDVRYAVRQLRLNPGFAAVALATLTFGIGATAAIFSVVDAVMLKPLPYRDADRLVTIHEASGVAVFPVNALHFTEWRRSAESFDGMALLAGEGLNVTTDGEPDRLAAARVSPALFSLLGIRPAIGRVFTDAEEGPGSERVVVVSDRVWRSRFGADPQIVGRSLSLNGVPYEIVGVLSADLQFPTLASLFPVAVGGDRPEIWMPLALRPNERAIAGAFNFACIARLKPGRSVAQATAEIDAIQGAIARRISSSSELRSQLVPLRSQIASRARTGLILIFGAVVAVLAIACVNVTNLLLARLSTRRRELTIRAAIGASRSRLVRQTVVESLVLSMLGGIGGAVLGYAAIQVILTAAPADLPRLAEVRLDLRALSFIFLLTTLTGLFVSVLPAIRFGRTDAAGALNSGARTIGASGTRLRALLVATEVALSTVCLVVAGLLLESFVRVLSADRGFDAARVVTADVNLVGGRYGGADGRTAFVYAAEERIAEIPGVRVVGVANRLPLTGEGGSNALFLDGVPDDIPLLERPMADIRFTNAAYFSAMGIALRAGRLFEERERSVVGLVSESAGRQAWPGENPIGKRFKVGRPDRQVVEVVGVVADVRGASLEGRAAATVYIPHWHGFPTSVSLIAKTNADPASIAPALRAAIREVDSTLPVASLRTMDDLVDASVADRRFQLQLVLLFGLAAMLLAALGVYGVLSYVVAQRKHEIGIRLALGAGRGAVRWMVMKQALTVVLAGLLAGAPAALAVGALLESALFEVRPYDAAVLGGAGALIIAIGAAGGYLPSARASRVDPSTTLRSE